MKNEKGTIVLAGGVIGLIAAILVFFGNPANMGFCIACFLRDTTGALGLHSAAAVQYIRPEIIGLVLGACIISLAKKEFSPRGGSAPVTRFTLGAFVMIGCLMFLGCPFRMILRLAGGDGNALFGLVGFVAGILTGTVFLKKGYTLKRSYKMPKLEGSIYPAFQIRDASVVGSCTCIYPFHRAGRRTWSKTCCNCYRTGSRNYRWNSGTENTSVYGRRYP